MSLCIYWRCHFTWNDVYLARNKNRVKFSSWNKKEIRAQSQRSRKKKNRHVYAFFFCCFLFFCDLKRKKTKRFHLHLFIAVCYWRNVLVLLCYATSLESSFQCENFSTALHFSAHVIISFLTALVAPKLFAGSFDGNFYLALLLYVETGTPLRNYKSNTKLCRFLLEFCLSLFCAPWHAILADTYLNFV